MKEHLLLLFIALVGVTGLLTIHQDVSARQNELVPYASIQMPLPVSTISGDKGNGVSQLNIDPESTWPIVELQVTHFNFTSEYYIDYGSGSRERVTHARHSFEVDHDGMMLIRLIKDGILIDAIELQFPSVESTIGKLVSS